jgi:hypothetical protein
MRLEAMPPALPKAATATLLAALFVAGCAHKPVEGDYIRGDTPATQFIRDAAGCELMAETGHSSQGYDGLTGVVALNNSYARIYDACMRSKGYPRKETR